MRLRAYAARMPAFPVRWRARRLRRRVLSSRGVLRPKVPSVRTLLGEPSLGLKLSRPIRSALISRALSLDQILGRLPLKEASSFKADGVGVRMRSHVLDHGTLCGGRDQYCSGLWARAWAAPWGTVRTTQPAFFRRVVDRVPGFCRASFPFLPGIGSSISLCPMMRLRGFFGEADAASSLPMLRRSASMRLTTSCGCGTARSRETTIPACFFLSISTAIPNGISGEVALSERHSRVGEFAVAHHWRAPCLASSCRHVGIGSPLSCQRTCRRSAKLKAASVPPAGNTLKTTDDK